MCMSGANLWAGRDQIRPLRDLKQQEEAEEGGAGLEELQGEEL